VASGPTAPELILPSEWLPVIWGGEEQFAHLLLLARAHGWRLVDRHLHQGAGGHDRRWPDQAARPG
jgi:hypothetical protein